MDEKELREIEERQKHELSHFGGTGNLWHLVSNDISSLVAEVRNLQEKFTVQKLAADFIEKQRQETARELENKKEELKKARNENAILKDALHWYANPECYRALYIVNAAVMIEKGERARQALREVENG